MVATKTSLNFRSALRAFSASAMFLAFLVAPAAHALGNDDFGNLGANTPALIDDINISLGGHDAIVKTVLLSSDFWATHEVAVKNIHWAMQTIEFLGGGGVTITRIHLKNLAKQGFMVGDASWVSVDGGARSEELIVRKRTQFSYGNDLAKSRLRLLGFNLAPRIAAANPVPEPGAALLFAAGLTATAVRRRRH